MLAYLVVKIRDISDTDQLTGLYNRRKLERELISQLATVSEYDTSHALLVMHLLMMSDTDIRNTCLVYRGNLVVETIASI